jgi:hypothetical protein
MLSAFPPLTFIGSSEMPDFVERTSRGWFSRILASFQGVFVGLILVVAAFPVLWKNEGCAVRIAKGLAEGRGEVAEAPSGQLNTALEGRLIHTTGRVSTATGALDPLFQFAQPDAVRIERRVEMYQWVEKVSERKEKKLGGSEETIRETTYVKEWTSSAVDSTHFKLQFKDGESTANPPLPLASASFQASDVRLGVYGLSASLVDEISGLQPMYLDATALQRFPVSLQSRGQVQLFDGGYYVGAHPGSPRVGDIRIRFEKVPASDVSVIAKLNGDRLGPWTTSTGTTIEMLSTGTKTADEMFTRAEEGNETRTWFVRFAGFLLMWIGFSMIFRPLSVVADVVPFIGTLVAWGLGFVSFALAAPLSLVTIAIAWIAYRPVIGISLLSAGVVIFGVMYVASRAKRAGGPTAQWAPGG